MDENPKINISDSEVLDNAFNKIADAITYLQPNWSIPYLEIKTEDEDLYSVGMIIKIHRPHKETFDE